MITLDRMTTQVVREERWNEFLAGLKPWEFHRLFAHPEQEMILHDAYIEGETTIKQIRLDLSFEPNYLEEFGEGDPRD